MVHMSRSSVWEPIETPSLLGLIGYLRHDEETILKDNLNYMSVYLIDYF